jgi:ketosteroid isomerase-like protein
MDEVAMALDRLGVRETIEECLNFLDAKDWEGVALCFSEDARAWYNNEPEALEGGGGVADFLRRRMLQYGPTDHALGNLRIEVNGELATCDSRLTASLLYLGEDGQTRIAVRAIWCRDKLRRVGDRWVIYERRHGPQWQYDVASHALQLL